ncbi:MAG: HEPN domain-containing protein [Micropepsaceae bacterium]
MADYAADFKFVLAKNAAYSHEERRKLPPIRAITTMLPHPSGRGSMICHPDAHDRLYDMAEGALAKSKYAGRIEVSAAFEELKRITVERFYRDKREITQSEADKAVAAAVKASAKVCKTLTHYIPCHIGDDKGDFAFELGRVHFRRSDVVMSDMASKFVSYVESVEEKRQDISQKLASDARSYYESFGWVAAVTIEDCDEAVSERRAKRAVQGALDCLHVLLGTEYSNHMRMGGPNFHTDRRSHIVEGAGCSIEVSSSADWLSNGLRKNWWNIIQGKAEDFLELMGIALEGALTLPTPLPVAQRYIDAATWYGQACRDEFLPSRLVKYVTAMERVLTTSSQNIAETLASRGAALLYRCLPEYEDFDRLKARFESVYDMRSRFVHGSRSPHDRIGQTLRDADELSRMVLFQILRLYKKEGLELAACSDDRMNEALDEWVELVRRDRQGHEASPSVG